MSWLPFICLVLGMGVLTVLYKGTVGHIHHMVHQLDEALGIHENRLNAYADDFVKVAEILQFIAKQHGIEVEVRIEDEPSRP